MNKNTTQLPQDVVGPATATGPSTPQISMLAKIFGAVAAVAIIVALAVGAYALMRIDTWGERNAAVPERFELDLTDQVRVDPRLIGYVEGTRFPTSLAEPHALAVGPDGALYVAGDRAVERLNAGGDATARVELEDTPSCLAVSSAEGERAGWMYVGNGRRVSVFNADGELVKQWTEFGEKSVLTAIAVAPHDVFVADAGQRVVLRFDLEGKLLNRIGEADPDRSMPGFIIPSPYFDLECGPDEVLFVVNPGMRRLEAYSYQGDLQSFWGSAGSRIETFFGCCNPAHIARMPDGRFVTSEKGIPRVKIYTADGDFQQVVAGPAELGVNAAALVDARGNESERVFDVAVGHNGEVLVLDARNRCIRVFQPTKDVSGKGNS